MDIQCCGVWRGEARRGEARRERESAVSAAGLRCQASKRAHTVSLDELEAIDHTLGQSWIERIEALTWLLLAEYIGNDTLGLLHREARGRG